VTEEIPTISTAAEAEAYGESNPTTRTALAEEYITRVNELESINSVQAQALVTKDQEIEGLRGEVARLGELAEQNRTEAAKVPELEQQLNDCQAAQAELHARLQAEVP
jgi:TolA-binding protein